MAFVSYRDWLISDTCYFPIGQPNGNASAIPLRNEIFIASLDKEVLTLSRHSRGERCLCTLARFITHHLLPLIDLIASDVGPTVSSKNQLPTSLIGYCGVHVELNESPATSRGSWRPKPKPELSISIRNSKSNESNRTLARASS